MKKILTEAEQRRRLVDMVIRRGDVGRRKRAMAGEAARRAATKRRKKERRQEKAAKLRLLAPWYDTDTYATNEERQRLALAGWKMLLVRMDPGTWYDAGQLKAMMPEYAKGSMRAWLWQMLPKLELIERAGNPDWTPPAPDATASLPRYLYRLSERGVEFRDKCCAQIGAV